ncbi:holin [Actinocrispum wychmicini]|uniref:Phage r1t holin n=1 Tax=Actinocrispum wychmicini TaxID=1213861 RepID=A0A4R2JII4_9PSEU|nr:holin [Actinocrispum wychmicini]TCO56806.1 phage r1t holin [Actinocrispum wychmicini]
MFSTAYLKDLAERALSSFAGGILTILGGDAVNAWNIDYKAALGVGLGAAIVSTLKGLTAKGVGDSDTAAFLPAHRD